MSGGESVAWSRDASRFTNGVALHPRGGHLYVVESTLPGIARIAIEPGAAGAYQVVELPETVPDGVAFAGAFPTLQLHFPA